MCTSVHVIEDLGGEAEFSFLSKLDPSQPFGLHPQCFTIHNSIHKLYVDLFVFPPFGVVSVNHGIYVGFCKFSDCAYGIDPSSNAD